MTERRQSLIPPVHRMTARYPCPCCGFVTFSEPSGSYEICVICGWEDDNLQLRDPGLSGGANRRSLYDEQRSGGWATLELDLFQGYQRSPGWRPAQREDCLDSRGESGGADVARAEYYWQPIRPAV